jgi:transposase-like protein
MSASTVRSAPSTVYRTSTASPVSRIAPTVAPAAVEIPRLRNARATAAEMSASSSGATVGSASSTVTSAPKER